MSKKRWNAILEIKGDASEPWKETYGLGYLQHITNHSPQELDVFDPLDRARRKRIHRNPKQSIQERFNDIANGRDDEEES